LLLCCRRYVRQSMSTLAQGLRCFAQTEPSCDKCRLASLVLTAWRSMSSGCPPSSDILTALRDCIPDFGHGRMEEAHEWLARFVLPARTCRCECVRPAWRKSRHEITMPALLSHLRPSRTKPYFLNTWPAVNEPAAAWMTCLSVSFAFPCGLSILCALSANPWAPWTSPTLYRQQAVDALFFF